MRYALKFAYDGSMFDGYARQPQGKTIEDAIIDAMISLAIIPKDGRGNLQSSSRTDKGVSSVANVITVTTDFQKDAIIKALNSKLEGIVFHSIAKVNGDFNPRHAKQRHYRYILLQSQCPEIEVMTQAATLFLGEHDFTHFCKTDTGNENTILTIDSIEISQFGEFIYIDIKAQRFLWQLVRRIVSFILAVARNEIDVRAVDEMLKGSAVMLASVKPMPPENLLLVDVDYGIEFEKIVDVGPFFSEQHQKAKARAEMMAQIIACF